MARGETQIQASLTLINASPQPLDNKTTPYLNKYACSSKSLKSKVKRLMALCTFMLIFEWLLPIFCVKGGGNFETVSAFKFHCMLHLSKSYQFSDKV
jgi:hypothetical protein